VTVLPDVTVGEKAVIGSGSVVTKNVPPKTVSYAVPAVVVMSIGEYEAKRKHFLRSETKGEQATRV